ncbi:PAS domain-containing protein [Bradyrhizobium sp. UNPA324]|uniref:PAS domain-containing protein n=1 Tax=Bradyrhizobium sp. UNPA324 TaxID=1141174 RepID=UPI001167CAAA|nr:PAS domain-containing protein [Bradyrhizobium sp. UNPA324]TQF33942.1 hypothetical protein UNPA324_33785 [Bradyrhizobium sp. UNPA324]
MQRFIGEQNIAHFERLLSEEQPEKSRAFIQEQLVASKRRLATLTAASMGVHSNAQIMRERAFARSAPKMTNKFQWQFEAAAKPLLLIDPNPGLHIVDANTAYASATMIEPGRVAGEKMFDVFPDNPDEPLADGVANLFASLRVVAETGQSDAMAVQRYDVRNASGVFVERYWQPLNSPVLNGSGNLAFILHQVIDVTSTYASAGRTV